MAAARPPPPFRLGKKQVFLPPVVVSMIPPMRRQPPNYVNFRVPLSFNKFDLRDYLYNAYSCPVLGVRSWIINSKPTQKILRGADESTRRSGRWYRPQAKKYMSVRLAEPFVVPARPPVEELKPWDYDLWRNVQHMKLLQILNHPQGRKEKPKAAADASHKVRLLRYYKDILPLPTQGEEAELKATAERARKLLRGEEKWEGNGAELDEKWVALARQLQEKEKWKMGLMAGPSGSAVAKKPEASEPGKVKIKGKGMVETGTGKWTNTIKGEGEDKVNDP